MHTDNTLSTHGDERTLHAYTVIPYNEHIRTTHGGECTPQSFGASVPEKLSKEEKLVTPNSDMNVPGSAGPVAGPGMV